MVNANPPRLGNVGVRVDMEGLPVSAGGPFAFLPLGLEALQAQPPPDQIAHGDSVGDGQGPHLLEFFRSAPKGNQVVTGPLVGGWCRHARSTARSHTTGSVSARKPPR